MAVILDPEAVETRVVHEVIDFDGARVLEIGCGDGRLTWRYADRAASVFAVDPKADEIERARAACPESLRSRVRLEAADVSTLTLTATSFDVAIFSWSL